MKTKNVLLILGMMFLAVVFTTSSCKKDDPDPEPEPTPTDYRPRFTATSYTEFDAIAFYIVCSSDDYELIKVEVKSPGGLQDLTAGGGGSLILKGDPIEFNPPWFLRLSGTWTFIVTGTIKSGDHIGQSFTESCSVSVSGK